MIMVGAMAGVHGITIVHTMVIPIMAVVDVIMPMEIPAPCVVIPIWLALPIIIVIALQLMVVAVVLTVHVNVLPTAIADAYLQVVG
jgi:hypothetical protein